MYYNEVASFTKSGCICDTVNKAKGGKSIKRVRKLQHARSSLEQFATGYKRNEEGHDNNWQIKTGNGNKRNEMCAQTLREALHKLTYNFRNTQIMFYFNERIKENIEKIPRGQESCRDTWRVSLYQYTWSDYHRLQNQPPAGSVHHRS